MGGDGTKREGGELKEIKEKETRGEEIQGGERRHKGEETRKDKKIR